MRAEEDEGAIYLNNQQLLSLTLALILKVAKPAFYAYRKELNDYLGRGEAPPFNRKSAIGYYLNNIACTLDPEYAKQVVPEEFQKGAHEAATRNADSRTA